MFKNILIRQYNKYNKNKKYIKTTKEQLIYLLNEVTERTVLLEDCQFLTEARYCLDDLDFIERVKND